ncbi:phosphoribosyl-AMP cyclohydrolase [Thermodesulfatator autotrophicus]|uniref:Phosphoribosyl-AMP cyclohydrolase n=1 Tax=Thermodesulfatator autotrophicus TaxID=1795632 RepID=A0A177EC16_9BACT|nr:phosphoribosyl-AMP cyclohydrolase [Thermodesulfatator autotrophicus]OAG28712.1 phosphoribosyl-AMP cyclohydrolase [Thermodesulfatator autotrophicus]
MVRPDFKKAGGLIPVIAQDYKTGEVLMLAYMNDEAWEKTLETGKVHYYSRSRNKIWLKGESSGHVQLVKEILLDCDLDTVLIKVEQLGGAACHKGYRSCFYRRLENNELKIIGKKIFDPEVVYGKKA